MPSVAIDIRGVSIRCGVNIAYFRLIIITLGLASCTKIEAQYAVCNLAQNVDPFVCYGILDE